MTNARNCLRVMFIYRGRRSKHKNYSFVPFEHVSIDLIRLPQESEETDMNNVGVSTSFSAPTRIEGPSAWKGPDLLLQKDWIHCLTESEIAEIDAAVHAVQASGIGFAGVSQETFVLPVLGARLAAILEDLLGGRGFVMIRGLPVDRYTEEQSAIAYLGLGAYLGSFRSQNAKGHLLGHVRDLGADIATPGTRFYQTNRALEYHPDSCDIVGLLCLRTARSGGESRIGNSVAIYNEMMARRSDLAAELFHAFPTDRRGE